MVQRVQPGRVQSVSAARRRLSALRLHGRLDRMYQCALRRRSHQSRADCCREQLAGRGRRGVWRGIKKHASRRVSQRNTRRAGLRAGGRVASVLENRVLRWKHAPVLRKHGQLDG